VPTLGTSRREGDPLLAINRLSSDRRGAGGISRLVRARAAFPLLHRITTVAPCIDAVRLSPSPWANSCTPTARPRRFLGGRRTPKTRLGVGDIEGGRRTWSLAPAPSKSVPNPGSCVSGNHAVTCASTDRTHLGIPACPHAAARSLKSAQRSVPEEWRGQS